jgi:hypothetical protein
MVGHVFRRTRERIERCLAQVLKGEFRFQPDRQIQECGVGSEAEELSEIALDLNIACHILFAESQRPAFKYVLCRAFRDKGENELWLARAVRLFYSIPKLHLKRHISGMIAQLFEELLECFSHDRPLQAFEKLRFAFEGEA